MTAPLRVVLVGAESTGKTTTCVELTVRLRARGGVWTSTVWVPEVGRERTIELMGEPSAGDGLDPGMAEIDWTPEEFLSIARAQNEREDQLATTTGPVLLCDTAAFATGIWEERYLGSTSIAVAAQARHHPLYLVPDPDGVPFVQDGIRDGEAIRGWMHERFLAELVRSGRDHVVLRGGREERRSVAETAIDQVIAGRRS